MVIIQRKSKLKLKLVVFKLILCRATINRDFSNNLLNLLNQFKEWIDQIGRKSDDEITTV